MDKHIFVLSIPSILEEVDKRTSYIGKMRVSDKTPDAMERLRLSPSEQFLSQEFLEEAAGETYDWIKAFGRNIAHAYRVMSGTPPTLLQENLGVHIQYAANKYAQKYTITSNEIEEIYSSGNTVILYMPEIKVFKGNASNVCYSVTVYYTTGVKGTPIKSHRQYSRTACFTTYSSNVGNITFTYPKPTFPFGTVELLDIERIEIEITKIDSAISIPKGSYVEMSYFDGHIAYGFLSSDYHSNQNITPEFEEEYDFDINDNIIMQIQLYDWQDKNMLPIVERNLKEALVNYIIYRWFEIVNTNESEAYLGKWEDKCRIAQLGLNTERKLLQRRLVDL